MNSLQAGGSFSSPPFSPFLSFPTVPFPPISLLVPVSPKIFQRIKLANIQAPTRPVRQPKGPTMIGEKLPHSS